MFRIRVLIIAMLVSLVAFSSACSVSQNGGTDGDVVSEIEDGSGDSWLIDPAVVEEDDDTEEVEAPVAEDNEVEGEEIDETVDEDTSAPVELVDIDIDTDAVVEDSYSQEFRALDVDRDYNWTIEGLPENTGLEFGKVGMADWKARLEGKPTMADVGTHTITVTVADAENASDSDSVTFDLTVESNVELPGVTKSTQKDICDKPMNIRAFWIGEDADGYTSSREIVARRHPLLGTKVKLKIVAGRGDGPAYGQVKFKIKSEVKDGLHCRLFEKEDAYDMPGPGEHKEDSEEYEYYWLNGGDCNPSAFGYDNMRAEKRWTKNPNWSIKGSIESDGFLTDKTYRSHSGKLEMDGELFYDGPLRVANLPIDEHARETIEITAEDECANRPANPHIPASNGKSVSNRINTRRIEFDVEYPDGEEGGRVEDVEVKLTYGNIGGYYKESGHGGNPYGYEVGEFDPLSTLNYFVIGFAGSALSDDARESFLAAQKLEGPTDTTGVDEYSPGVDRNYAFADIKPALTDFYGHTAYSIRDCDNDETYCAERKMTPSKGHSTVEISKVRRIYLMWRAPMWRDGYKNRDRHYMDFDIQKIRFRTKYWTATYYERDDYVDDLYPDQLDGYINKNIAKKNVEIQNITQRDVFPGMGDANASGGVFKRRELAGYRKPAQ